MKKNVLRIMALLLSVGMLCALAGCADADKAVEAVDFGMGQDRFISEFNEYLLLIMQDDNNSETVSTMYDTIKLTKERIQPMDEEDISLDTVGFTDSSSLIASLFCFKNPENGNYSEFMVWAPYASYSQNLNSYFLFNELSAAGVCVAARVDKNDREMIKKASELVGDVCSTVKTTGAQSQLVRFGDACFYARFSEVSEDSTDPRVFFYMVPAQNCQGYVDYDEFAKTIDTNIDDELSGQ